MDKPKTYEIDFLLDLSKKVSDTFPIDAQFLIKHKKNHWRNNVSKLKVTWLLEKEKDDEKIILANIQKILNKLSDSNFDELSDEINNIKIYNYNQLKEMVNMIFEKAVLEITYTRLYAELSKILINLYIIDSKRHIYFKNILIQRCQKAFSKYLSVSNKLPVEDEADYLQKLTGTMKFIGELYNTDIISIDNIEKIFSIIYSKIEVKDYYSIDAYVELMMIVGKKLFKDHNDIATKYYNKLLEIKKLSFISKKNKFFIMDVIDMKKNNNW